jgi:hypothetical protein
MEKKAMQQARPVTAGLTPPLNPDATYIGRPNEENPVELRIGELIKDAQAVNSEEEVACPYRLKLTPSEAGKLIEYCRQASSDNQPLHILPARGGVEKKD